MNRLPRIFCYASAFLCLLTLAASLSTRTRPLTILHARLNDAQARTTWLALHAGRFAFGDSAMPQGHLTLQRDLVLLEQELDPLREQSRLILVQLLGEGLLADAPVPPELEQRRRALHTQLQVLHRQSMPLDHRAEILRNQLTHLRDENFAAPGLHLTRSPDTWFARPAFSSNLLHWSCFGASLDRQELPIIEVGPVGSARVSTATVACLAFPIWLPIFLFAITPAFFIRAALLRRHRALRRLCPSCGYDLRATPEKCPECGHTPPASPATPDTLAPDSHSSTPQTVQ